MPRSLLWDSDRSREYPGIANFALRRRLAMMAAHDSILVNANASLSGNNDPKNAPKTLTPDTAQKSARQPGATSDTKRDDGRKLEGPADSQTHNLPGGRHSRCGGARREGSRASLALDAAHACRLPLASARTNIQRQWREKGREYLSAGDKRAQSYGRKLPKAKAQIRRQARVGRTYLHGGVRPATYAISAGGKSSRKIAKLVRDSAWLPTIQTAWFRALKSIRSLRT
ncbi:hypothetical protein B0H19DRAFT_1065582 [Mycena capillaripes]|nr:hypothetical protein B0H19DRAFT_1065582 [Mycena capillaripes]